MLDHNLTHDLEQSVAMAEDDLDDLANGLAALENLPERLKGQYVKLAMMELRLAMAHAEYRRDGFAARLAAGI